MAGEQDMLEGSVGSGLRSLLENALHGLGFSYAMNQMSIIYPP